MVTNTQRRELANISDPKLRAELSKTLTDAGEVAFTKTSPGGSGFQRIKEQIASNVSDVRRSLINKGFSSQDVTQATEFLLEKRQAVKRDIAGRQARLKPYQKKLRDIAEFERTEQKRFVEARTLKRLREGTTATLTPGTSIGRRFDIREFTPESQAEIRSFQAQESKRLGSITQERIDRNKEIIKTTGLDFSPITTGSVMVDNRTPSQETMILPQPKTSILISKNQFSGDFQPPASGLIVGPPRDERLADSLKLIADVGLDTLTKSAQDIKAGFFSTIEDIGSGIFERPIGKIKTDKGIGTEDVLFPIVPETLGKVVGGVESTLSFAFEDVLKGLETGFKFVTSKKGQEQIAAVSKSVSSAIKEDPFGALLVGGTVATVAAFEIFGGVTEEFRKEPIKTSTEFLAAGEVIKLGGKTVKTIFAGKRRVINLDLVKGRLQTITFQDGGEFVGRDIDISKLTNIFKKTKKIPSVFDDVAGASDDVLRLSKRPPTTFFRGTDVTVGETIIKTGGAFGFVNQELAEGFKRSGSLKEVRQFESTQFIIDTKIRGAVSRKIPTDVGTKTITSTQPEFIALDVVSEKVVTPTLTPKQKQKITATELSSSILRSDIFSPSLQTVAGVLAGGLAPVAPLAPIIFGRSMRITKAGKSVPRRRAEKPNEQFGIPSINLGKTKGFQQFKKQSGRQSRIIRLEKQQRQQQFKGLFQEQQVLKQGKRRLIQTQKFQPFIDIEQDISGKIIQTITKVPKGGSEKIFFTKGKPLIIQERLGKITLGQRPELFRKRVISIGKGGIQGIKDVPIGKGAFPKGFGSQSVDRPTGDINKLVQITEGIATFQRVPSQPKIRKVKQPIIKEVIDDAQLNLLPEPTQPKILSTPPQQHSQLRGGFRKGTRGKLLERIRQRESERRLQQEVEGFQGVEPGGFGQSVFQRVEETFGPKKKGRKGLTIFQEPEIIRGFGPIETGALAVTSQVPSNIFGGFGPVGRARTIRKARIGNNNFNENFFRQAGEQIGTQQARLGTETIINQAQSLGVESALGLGLIRSQSQLQSLDQQQGLDTSQFLGTESIQSQGLSLDQVQALGQQQVLDQPQGLDFFNNVLDGKGKGRKGFIDFGDGRIPERTRDVFRDIGDPFGEDPPPPDKTIKRIPLAFNKNNKIFGTNQGYDIIIREKGKDIKANKKPLLRNRARNVGANIVDNSAVASFRIRKSKKAPQGFIDDSSFGLQRKFRSPATKSRLPPKQFVERRTFRIDSAGEKLGITAKGLIANRRKAQRNAFLSGGFGI